MKVLAIIYNAKQLTSYPLHSISLAFAVQLLKKSPAYAFIRVSDYRISATSDILITLSVPGEQPRR